MIIHLEMKVINGVFCICQRVSSCRKHVVAASETSTCKLVGPSSLYINL
jgi:hypothetical protein